MTIHAFPEIYLNKAQILLGDAFDYAINACGISGERFVRLFLRSPISKKLEKGDPSCLCAKSGIEVAMDLLGSEAKEPTKPISAKRSPEYWIGWAIAYYQWLTDQSYETIFDAVSYQDLSDLYQALHQASLSKFVETLDALVHKTYPTTNLRRMRAYRGQSQAELSKETGVSLRSIQMYEQRQKDINKASAETLYRLSKALGCDMEDLLEKRPKA